MKHVELIPGFEIQCVIYDDDLTNANYAYSNREASIIEFMQVLAPKSIHPSAWRKDSVSPKLDR